MPNIAPRPTTFAGTKYESKLEATWAVFFNFLEEESLGEINWKYHPFEIDHYVPDFLIKEPFNLVIEVKPRKPNKEYLHYKRSIIRKIKTEFDFVFACGTFYQKKVPYFMEITGGNQKLTVIPFTKFLPGKLKLSKTLVKHCLKQTKYYRFDI